MTVKLSEKLEQKDQELRILHEVAKDISSNLELNELLGRIVTMIMNFVPADSCLIYLYDRQNDELILTASSKPREKSIGRVKLKMGEGVTGWAAKENRPVVLPKEAYKDQRFRRSPLLRKINIRRLCRYLSSPRMRLSAL